MGITNNVDYKIGNPELGVLFFGVFYLMYRKLWLHTFLFLLLALPTVGLVWIWYIFKTRKYIRKRLYENQPNKIINGGIIIVYPGETWEVDRWKR